MIEIELGGMNEDDIIDALFTADKNYGDSADYDLYPKKGDDVGPLGDGYNSNSYIAGLLEFLNLLTRLVDEVKSNVPGFDKPLPDRYFMNEYSIRDSWMPPPTEEEEGL